MIASAAQTDMYGNSYNGYAYYWWYYSIPASRCHAPGEQS